MKKLRRFKRKEKGFTLIELLIVVAILGVLAAVVIPNVVGLMGRGGNQAYETDDEVIQLAAATFFSDSHAGHRDDSGTIYWSCNDTTIGGTLLKAGHYYPTSLAEMPLHTLELSTVVYDPDNLNNPRINSDDAGTAAGDPDITAHSIWMGLLINEAGSACVDVGGDPGDCDGTVDREACAPLLHETSLYLQEMPESASADNGNTLTPGGYTWVVGENGAVYGAYESNGVWYSGFSGGYP